MSGKKLKIADVQKFCFAGNATFTVVRPERTTKVVENGVEVEKKQPLTRYTFKLTRAKGEESDRPWFAKVMFGPNNEADFVFLGTVFPSETGPVLRSSAKSPIKPTDARFVALNWLIERLAAIAAVELKSFEAKLAGELFAPAELADELAGPVADLTKIEVWHEGTCGRCGRKLTTPESIARGLGPECAALKVEQ